MRRLVGRNLRRFRAAAGLTQEQLSARTGFPQQHISEIERGHGNPTVLTLYEIGLALGVTPVDLVSPDQEAERESPPAVRKF
ncbi:helix-turn-helix transcriptional regulator [Phenylobacterium glaciei]|uniref:helix-turn-helix transcriptional regulator n=1 Tax=Phenylobacterium glaciei TaxID=2803784 RepID=UPI00201BFE82|nr:helix-turn-helix transcriptional regulator [Phenylobacterium glaciei]